MTGRPRPRRLPSGKTERKLAGGKGGTQAEASQERRACRHGRGQDHLLQPVQAAAN